MSIETLLPLIRSNLSFTIRRVPARKRDSTSLKETGHDDRYRSKFAAPDGASQALESIVELQRQHFIKLHDAAIVSWPKGKKQPTTKQLVDLVGAGAVSGMFWGMLLGFIFVAPFFGMAVGAAFGALGGAFRDYGIDDNFIAQTRTQVTEGTSALFLMTSDAVIDRVADGMKHVKFEIIATNLSKDQEQKLREAFSQE